VVAGMRYNITLKLGTTDCRIASHSRGVAQDLAACTTTKVEKCDVTVVEQVWQDPPRTLVEMKCKPVRAAAQKTSQNGILVSQFSINEACSDRISIV